MHPREKTRLLLAAAALTATAAVLSLVIVLTSVDVATVGSFAALAVLGWLVVATVNRLIDRKATDEAPAARREPQLEATVTSTESPASAQAGADVDPRGAQPQETRSDAPAGETSSDDAGSDEPAGATGPDEPSAQQSDESEPHMAPAPAAVDVPETVEPDVVVYALLGVVRAVGDPISVGLWLEDPATATMRLIRGAGRMPPTDTPISTEDDPVGTSLSHGSPAWYPDSHVTMAQGSGRAWRFIQPLEAGETRGAVLVDVIPEGDWSMVRVLDLVAPLRGALAGALALHVARRESNVARALIEAADELTRCAGAGDVLERGLDKAMSLASAETGSVMLADEDETMRIVAARGLPDDVVDSTIVPRGEGIAGWVLASESPVLIEDLPGKKGDSPRRGVRSAVSVPLTDDEGTIGVLSVGSRAFPARFTREHMDAVAVLGRQMCTAYRGAKALGSAQELYLSSLKALAVAMETKDPYSRGSTERVFDLCVALGRAMALPEEAMTSLELAALFHDVGMAVAGSSFGRENRPLTTAERGLLRMHPVVASRILEASPKLKDVAPVVLHHHERYDGRGYASGISGDAIPLGSRILSVVDAYVAMTSPRPYRDAKTPSAALDELERLAGTQFDPVVVERFVETLREQERSRGRAE